MVGPISEPAIQRKFEWSEDKKTITVKAESNAVWKTEDLISHLHEIQKQSVGLDNTIIGNEQQAQQLKKTKEIMTNDITELTKLLRDDMGVMKSGKDNPDE